MAVVDGNVMAINPGEDEKYVEYCMQYFYKDLQNTALLVNCVVALKEKHMHYNVAHSGCVSFTGKGCSSGTTFSLAMHLTAEITSKA